MANRLAVPLVSWLGAACLAIAWLVPNHYPPWNSFYNECLAVFGLLLLAASALRLKEFGIVPPALVAGLVAAVPWLEWSTGQLRFSGDAWIASLYLACFAMAIQTGYTTSAHPASRLAAMLAGATLSAALVSAALAAAQCLDLPTGIWIAEIPFGTRGTANVAQPNNLSTLLGMGATGLWLLFEQGQVRRSLAVMALGILLVGATLTQSRTGLLFGPALILMRIAMRRPMAPWRVSAGILIVAIGLQWSLALAWPHAREALGLAAPESLAQLDLQSGRWQVWPVLLDGALQKPWFGYGWLQNGAAQLAVAERHPQVDELFLQAHDIFLDLVIWCGLPLGLLLGGLLVTWFISRVRGARTLEAAIGLMSVAVFGIHAMLELPHHYAYFLIPIGLWVGSIEAQRGSRCIGPRWVPTALMMVTASLALAVAWDYPAVEEDFRLVRFESLSIGSLRATQPAPDAPFLSSLTTYLRVSRTRVTSGMRQADLTEMDALSRRYPYSPVLYRYAKALALNGDQRQALLLLDKMRHIHGELRYQTVRKSLHQEVLEGQTGLAALDAEMPR